MVSSQLGLLRSPLVPASSADLALLGLQSPATLLQETQEEGCSLVAAVLQYEGTHLTYLPHLCRLQLKNEWRPSSLFFLLHRTSRSRSSNPEPEVFSPDNMIPQEVDVIVVGGGPAGCATAGRLARADPNLQVLLLEAGANNEEDPSVYRPGVCK